MKVLTVLAIILILPAVIAGTLAACCVGGEKCFRKGGI